MAKYLIVGDGLSALGFLQALKEDGEKGEILWVSDSQNLKACSRYSTAMVSLSGISRGVSELGDRLYDSFHKAKAFYENQNPDGVTKASRRVFPKNDDDLERLKKRYQDEAARDSLNEECFLIEPEAFLTWWKENLLKSLSLKFQEGFVKELKKTEKGYRVVLLGQSELKAEKVVLATGAYTKLVPIQEEVDPKIKVGHYLQWSEIESDEDSFCYSLGHENLIWKKASKSLTLGSFDNDQEILLLERKSVQVAHEKFKELCPWLPSLKEAKTLVGLRTKGSKRLPKVQAIDSNLYYIGNFYKNGYSLCFSMGKELRDLIKSNYPQ